MNSSISLTQKAKQIKQEVSMVDFLSRLGFAPYGKPGRQTMYLSMLRDSDTDASFSVSETRQFWYDHGMGKGGNIIDFAMLYWKGISFPEAVDKIQQVCDLVVSDSLGVSAGDRPRIREAVKLPNYKIQSVKPFGTTDGINAYLRSRGIFEQGAGRLSEVFYYVEDEKKVRKNFFAAGWQNELGGWEVRNKYFKGCLGKKAVSFIPADPKKLVVFEGYMNYLSWLKDHPGAGSSVLVLNSLALLESGIALAKNFPDIGVYLDHDKSGYTALGVWMKALPYSTDRSAIYEGYNDYNDKTKAEMKAARSSYIGR
ncbi:MAG TPA: CHC2 zinc finger domain-containing protein [Pedobacter sp.]|uniref:CHC2 zinc finger domain-containing protein n=1 Tax=Pedobacter sp. TaxID=1411316 RepID=UPI002C7FB167|nr:CHC2 zinc finger domain-containing protein [Pedobacter sp.]HMI04874.1 CHC2 zinc finger domain-containing protein [Pedobacter sp.]